jgi:hypothetical protein
MSLKATHTQRLGTSTPPMSLSPTLFLPLSLCASLSPSIYHPSSLLERPPPRQRNAIVIAPAPALLRRSPPRRLLMTRDTRHTTRRTTHVTQHTTHAEEPTTNDQRRAHAIRTNAQLLHLPDLLHHSRSSSRYITPRLSPQLPRRLSRWSRGRASAGSAGLDGETR